MKTLKPLVPFQHAALAGAILAVFQSSAFADSAMLDYEVIEVKGATTLNTNISAQATFGNAQHLTQQDIENSVSRSLPELLKTQLASVNLNDVQNNPFNQIYSIVGLPLHRYLAYHKVSLCISMAGVQIMSLATPYTGI